MTCFACHTCRFFGAEHPDYPGIHFCYLPGHGVSDDRLDVKRYAICLKWELNPQAESFPFQSDTYNLSRDCARFEAHFKMSERDP